MSQKNTQNQKDGREALRGALGEDTWVRLFSFSKQNNSNKFLFCFRASEQSESFRSVSTNGNLTTSPSKRSSPRKAVGKENSTPRNRPPVTKRKPTPKGKKKTPPARSKTAGKSNAGGSSKAASSRTKPSQPSSDESDDEETPQRAKHSKAPAAQKKNTRAPTPSESEDEEPSSEAQSRSGRSQFRQPRAPASPTPRPVGRPKKIPITKVQPSQRQAVAAKQAAAAMQVGKPQGAAKRKQQVPVLREMHRLQTSVECQIPRAPFSRLVREIVQRIEMRNAAMRITPEALEALRESSESFLVQVFSDAYLITLNRKQVTLAPKDIQLLMFLRGPAGGQPRV